MSIQQGNEIKELRGRIEKLERSMNIISPDKRIIAGQPEPEPELPKIGRKKRS